MGLLAKSTSFVLISSLFFVFVASTVSGQEQPKPESLWIDKELHSEIIWQETPQDQSTSYGPQQDSNCESITYYKRNLPLLPYTEEVNASCAHRLGTEGYINGGDLLIGSGIAGAHYGMGSSYKVAGGQDAVIVRHGNGFRFINNLTKVAIPNFSFISGRLSYTVPFSTDQIVLNAVGQQANWMNGRITATSTNGYIVVNQSNGSMIRINPATGETLFFGNGTFFKYGGTTRKAKFVHLSGGGRYAIVGENKGEAYLYDLERCSGDISRSSESSQHYYSEYCDYINIDEYLETTYNQGHSVWIENIDFDRTSQINVTFGYRDSDNVTQVVNVRMAPGDQDLTDRELSYVALGDSFASGEGDLDASWYELGTDVPENNCHLSMRSYPYLLADILSIEDSHSVACSGAVIEDVTTIAQYDEVLTKDIPVNNLGSWYPGIKLQTEYLSDVSDKPLFTTVSISGNDAGFSGKLIECAVGPGTCKYAEEGKHREYVAKEIAALKSRLIETYEKIYESTDNKTKLFAMSYPKFIQGSGGSCGLNVRLNDSEREFIDEAVELINEVIRSAAQEVGAEFINIGNALANYNLCSYSPDNLMAVNGLTKGNDVLGFVVGLESYHPNQNGHELITQSFLKQVEYSPETYGSCGKDAGPCNPTKNPLALTNVDYWGLGAATYVNMLNDNLHQKLPRRPQTLAMVVGDTVSTGIKVVKDISEVVVDGLKPSSWVDFILNSEPIDLGSYQVDASGRLVAIITIPAEATEGIHTINAFGVDTFGNEVHYYEHVAIGSGSGACGLISESGADQDGDGIDDACDPIYIAQSDDDATTISTDFGHDVSADEVSSIEGEQENTEAETNMRTSNYEFINASTQLALSNDENGSILGDDSQALHRAGTLSSIDDSQNLDTIVVAILTIGGFAVLMVAARYVLRS